MGRPKSPNQTEQLNIRVPTAIITKVRVLLTQPLTGKIPYNGLSVLVTGLLIKWLEKQEDLFEERNKDGHGHSYITTQRS